ncbi:U-box domain-containing protein 35-like isoform X1 [Papaver somniferum]|uniref:U-box domain-containing protein 35-like isoform X1 n=1 Tax=Papaver somniferum TaxID=3469 RepID=UPI000E6F9044|nr:U-box domain-containing protein 35-like isoform X1 [Papaver somniferum]
MGHSVRGDDELGMPNVVVAIDKDKNSQFALKWAIENLPISNQSIILLHVKVKSYQSDGSSHGSNDSNKDPAESSESQQLFLPFRGFCARKGFISKEVVLEDTDVPRTIADYVDSNYITYVVLGASHRNAITRNFMKKQEVPSAVVKLAPDFCNVHVISKSKAVTIRSASRPVPVGAPARNQSSPKVVDALPPKHLSASDNSDSEDSNTETCNDNYRTVVNSPRRSHRKSTGSRLPGLSRFLDCGMCRSRSMYARGPSRRGPGPVPVERRAGPSFGTKSVEHHLAQTPPRDRLKHTNKNAPIKNNLAKNPHDRFARSPVAAKQQDYPYDSHSTVSSNSSNGSPGSSQRLSQSGYDFVDEISGSSEETATANKEIELEMMRLKMELQQTMDLYSKACKDAITAKQTAHDLQRWKMQENCKYELAKAAQEQALEQAKIEQLKTQEALEAAHKSQKVAQMEARKAMEAEIKSHCEAEDKNKVPSSFNYCRYRRYTVQEIEYATNNFAESSKIGEGGYGPVYRTTIDHTPVAVKLLRSDAAQGMQQFQQEVEILSCIRHPNMVLLLGACPENGCLVYEYMDNGSLDDRLFRRGDTPPIPWNIRFKIAAEIATALLFLHQTKPEPLVHRDLKPGNILLDRNYTSKISDVGLARLVPPSMADNVTQYRMTSAAGTFCYIDPEYQQTGMLGTKSDVYSLGIMLLQIITARPPMGLAHYVARAIEKGTFVDMLDPTVPDWPVEEALAFAKIAIQCAELRKKDRPDLGTVILPEINRLKELGMSESNEASFYGHAPWSYSVHSRPVSSVTSQATTVKSYMLGAP